MMISLKCKRTIKVKLISFFIPKLKIFYNVTFIFSDLGTHIDGYIAVVAHTIIVGATPDKKITGRKADVFLAAYNASQAALRLLKPKTDVSFI